MSEWISVKERLPEVFVAVLAYCPANQNVYEVYLNARGEWHFFDKTVAGALVDESVTYFMPLPEPPVDIAELATTTATGSETERVHEEG